MNWVDLVRSCLTTKPSNVLKTKISATVYGLLILLIKPNMPFSNKVSREIMTDTDNVVLRSHAGLKNKFFCHPFQNLVIDEAQSIYFMLIFNQIEIWGSYHQLLMRS